MFTLHDLFVYSEEKRANILELFTKVDKEHLYFTAAENTWSAEYIFRHLLSSLKWTSGYLPGEPIDEPEHSMPWGVVPEDTVTIEQLIDSFAVSSKIINERIKNLTNDEAKEEIEGFGGLSSRKKLLLFLMTHDHGHLGQITWLLKRSTGWTDKEIYGAE
ncbi:MAG: DinB family protein [Candidatus Heimdallarchaeota archaeon]|nr:DinB family protein [Candidatus Heimdallarchaeota archaeon]MCK5048477.1 DinB family protein [Candidatus Heimdallarchaeota archaeon]